MTVSSFSSPPPAGKDDVMAIIYSGDGGWADLDRRLGIAFIDRGIPVLGGRGSGRGPTLTPEPRWSQ
ncbi:MAG: hypothetical protein WDW36_002553 [Sanguina aurantia]